MSHETCDVVIVGGGVIGLSIAYYCAREKLSVTILDRGPLGQESSWAGAGIIPAGRSATARSHYARLLGLSSELFPQLSAELRDETGIDNGYVRCGGLEIGFDPADAHALRSAAGHYAKDGIPWEELSPEAARGLEPALQGPFHVAYHVPEMAQVRNPRHLKALAAACARRDVRIVTAAPVTGFERDGERVAGVHTIEQRYSAATTVLAAGAWSGQVLQAIGVPLPIKPIRGQIVLLATDAPVLSRVIMMGREYLVPRLDGRLLVGSTEEDVGFDKRPTPRGVGHLLEIATRIVPALESVYLERAWAGLRPASADGKPFIGPVPGRPGLIVAAGHFRSGLQLSPVTGLVVQELVCSRRPSVALDAFRLDRPIVDRRDGEAHGDEI